MRAPLARRPLRPPAAAQACARPPGLSPPLSFRRRVPAPFAAVVALHGMSDYSNALAMPAPWWAEHGITTYAYDQRGFGRSPPLGIWPGNAVLRRDLADFVEVVKTRHPGLPVYVLGE